MLWTLASPALGISIDLVANSIIFTRPGSTRFFTFHPVKPVSTEALKRAEIVLTSPVVFARI